MQGFCPPPAEIEWDFFRNLQVKTPSEELEAKEDGARRIRLGHVNMQTKSAPPPSGGGGGPEDRS